MRAVGDPVRDQEGGIVLMVRVKARASKSRVLAVTDGLLEVAVAAPPVDGEANAELLRTVATFFGLPRGRLSVQRGATSRLKSLFLQGLNRSAAEACLAKLPPGRKSESTER
jgi:uncharacterized protein (TIGR00251 family)